MGSMTICNLGDVLLSFTFAGIGEVLPAMEHYGFRLCSLQDLAELKVMQTMVNRNKVDSLFDNGPILTREAILCIPGNPPEARLVKNSPLLEPHARFIPEQGIVFESAKIADERNVVGFTGKEVYMSAIDELEKTNFFMTEEQSHSLENSVEFPVVEKKDLGRFVELKNFKKNKLISYAFGANIDMYTKSLAMSGIKGIRIYPESSESINGFEKPFVRQVVYGRDETADICLHSVILFAQRKFYIFGIKI
jgi:hypothetical protein